VKHGTNEGGARDERNGGREVRPRGMPLRRVRDDQLQKGRRDTFLALPSRLLMPIPGPATTIQGQLLRRNVKRFRGGLVFKARRHLCHSTLGLRVIKKKRKDRYDAKLPVNFCCSLEPVPKSAVSFSYTKVYLVIYDSA